MAWNLPFSTRAKPTGWLFFHPLLPRLNGVYYGMVMWTRRIDDPRYFFFVSPLHFQTNPLTRFCWDEPSSRIMGVWEEPPWWYGTWVKVVMLRFCCSDAPLFVLSFSTLGSSSSLRSLAHLEVRNLVATVHFSFWWCYLYWCSWDYS